MVGFTHIQDDKAQMVDISGKGYVMSELWQPARYTCDQLHSQKYEQEPS
jgi:hypothetical protein